MTTLLRVLTVIGAGLVIGFGLIWWKIRLPPSGRTSETLSDMVDADQAIRSRGTGDFYTIVEWKIGDWLRTRRVRRIVKADRLETARDYRRAAFLLQHGHRSSDYALARDLASEAVKRGDESARNLQALAEDRYLLSTGEAQKYGSQIQCTPQEGWTLEPLDPSTTDEERATVGIAPLAELKERVQRIDEMTEGSCELDTGQMRKLERMMHSSASEIPIAK
jgi:hypothetical protein